MLTRSWSYSMWCFWLASAVNAKHFQVLRKIKRRTALKPVKIHESCKMRVKNTTTFRDEDFTKE
uniref:Secreted protein n=1 Tax=Physcomitrium patens TaxID=3218 RepID=A0A2K1KEV7_PHYPA|nr:hypothetical protein PHYPA_008687 [Physcomitrium patens]